MPNRTLSLSFAGRALLAAGLGLWGSACHRAPAPPPAPSVAQAPSFDRDGWLADYDALKRHLGTRYANLEWNVSMRGLDVAALNRQTLEALRAVAAFLAAFKDPHLRWESPAAFAQRARYGLKLFGDGKLAVVRALD